MGISIKPITCPGGCLGCYEREARESGRAPAWDIEKVLFALEAQMALDTKKNHNAPTLHGGEPLTLPLAEIDSILKAVFKHYGRTSIQTSGHLLRPDHASLFIKYKTNVGISIDGDNARTNAGRWNAPGFDVAEMTEKTLSAMNYLQAAGVEMGAIAVLRKCNAGTPALRDETIVFGERLIRDFGITVMRFNQVIAFDARTADEEELDEDSLADMFRRLIIRQVASGGKIHWSPAVDFLAVMAGKPAECSFSECDPWATEAEVTILGDGSLGNCLKGGGGSEGVFASRPEKSRARYELLAQVRQEAGGCKGCFWWPYCKGGCPGAGIDGDWRNRTRFCGAMKRAFAFCSSLSEFTVDRKPGENGKWKLISGHGDSNDPKWRELNPDWGKK